jgi:putative FmdB family regulatory protein
MMPIYIWKCPKCGRLKETLQKIDDPPPVCEGCEAEMERVPQRFGFRVPSPAPSSIKGWNV